jgi:hypothetical protein
LWATEAYRRMGQIGPAPVFCTWLLFVLTGAPEFASWVRAGTDPTVFFSNFLTF